MGQSATEETAERPRRWWRRGTGTAAGSGGAVESGLEVAGEPPETERTSRGPSRKEVITVAAVGAVLAAVVAGEAWYLWGTEDEVASEQRPVVLDQIEVNQVVDDAAESLSDIVSTSYKNYDEQTDQARALMTTSFADEYVLTAEDVKAGIVDGKTEVAVEIRSQSIVRASQQHAEVLVFFNQIVTKNDENPRQTPFRALVTMTRADAEATDWRVDAIDTASEPVVGGSEPERSDE